MEIVGFLYETLSPLSAPVNDSTSLTLPEYEPTDSYSVFRNEIASSSLNCPSPLTTAPDYFSLDVDAEDDVSGSKQPSSPPPPPPPPPSTISTPVPSTKQPTTLESGWFRANSRFRSPMLQLHKEILDFCDFLSPTLEEQESRKAAVDSVFDVIKYIWPHCKVEVFGSFKTGLYLPTSDVDAVIFDSRVSTPQKGLYALSRALSKRDVAKKIQVIAKARVPIIKFLEKKSDIAFDISFDAHNGPQAAEFIKDAVTKFPPLRPLCLILKVFLQQRELNEVYSGGIGSYTLLAMLIAQLQMHWKGQYFQGSRDSLENNLGILLVNFFDFYGRKLNIWDVGVSCQGSGAFFLKTNKGFLNEDRPHLLCIEDPQAPENDIGKNSFNYSQVRSAFGLAFSILTNAKAIMDLGPNRSILGTIIRPDPLLIDRKGGANGEVTFDSLLPGAGEPVESPFQTQQDIMCNWKLDDDEPLPRNGTPGDDGRSRSSKKKKARKEKRRLKLKENGDGPEENGSRKEKKSKRRWKDRDYRNADDGSP